MKKKKHYKKNRFQSKNWTFWIAKKNWTKRYENDAAQVFDTWQFEIKEIRFLVKSSASKSTSLVVQEEILNLQLLWSINHKGSQTKI